MRSIRISSDWTRVVVALLLWAGAGGGAPAQPVPSAPLSPRNANYTLDVRLDPETRMLTGRQILEWRNVRDRPTAELRFHLYWNAWRNNRSTWMLEARSRRGTDPAEDVEREDWGWIDVEAIRLVGPEEPGLVRPTLASRIVAPDDGNLDDRTVMVVDLPRPVGPGETVRVALSWRAKVPRTFARTGYRGNYFFIAHWFPKLGVYEDDGWNCHQFHASTEFYSDYGVYDVKMTVPEGWVLGATGREVTRQENDDGTVTHRYRQADVHAFTWTTSPSFVEREARFESPGLPPVEMRLLIQPEHLDRAERVFAATRATLRSYGTWYGPYPYGHVTIVDVAHGSRTGGMEYPTLFTIGMRRFSPPRGGSPEGVTIHEAGHQFWYGIVGNNEFEHAWLDEGFDTFSTIRTLDTAYEGRVLVDRYLRGFFPVRFHDIEDSSWNGVLQDYRRGATSDTPSTPTYLCLGRTVRSLSYDKTALWLLTLERHLGWNTLQSILSTYFDRYKFRHPTPEDFFAVAEEVAGRDLSWFFDQVHYDSVEFDYGVLSVDSFPAERKGWVEEEGRLVYLEPEEDTGEKETAEAGPAEPDKVYRNEVVVRRWGGGRFPVEVRMVFEDGHEIRESWDGESRWKAFVVERASKLDYAEVDPDRVLMLDTNRTNNSRLREPAARMPAVKWSAKWMVWFQDMLSTMTFFM